MEEQNKRKTLILTIIAVLTLIILIGGATYAYFQSQVGKGESTTLNVKAGTTDDLSFSLKDLNATKEKVSDNDNTIPIVIEPNQTNFASGKDSIADGVTGTATLIAGDDDYITEDGEFTYNVYLNITKNELQYTSYKKKVPDETSENVLSFKDEATKAEASLEEYDPRPELYLTIKKNGNEVTKGVTINDKALSYTSEIFTEGETQLGGFDITETKGLIKISVPTDIKVENKDKENHTTTDTWEIIVTFMNLDTDQYLNTGKSVVGEVLIQSEEIKQESIQDKLLADANKDDKTTLYYHNVDLTGGAQDDSYRYAGSFEEVKNYVCLDGGATTTGECESDNDLYRIIGLFKNNEDKYEIKLIKYDYATSIQLGETGAYGGLYEENTDDDRSNYKGNQDNFTNIGGYYWTSEDNEVNEWAGSALRETNLNEYYLNTYLKETKHIDVDKLITNHTWSLNGHDDNQVTPKIMYDNEMDKVESSPSNPTVTKTIENKIGLIYVSDYGYAASPSITNNWATTLYDYDTDNIPDNNWMYMGLLEWTISRVSSYGINAFVVSITGFVYSSYGTSVGSSAPGVRPVFYLTSDAKIKEGDGSKEVPYRITFE